MFAGIVNTIGYDRFIIVLLAVLPFLSLIIIDIIFIRKDFSKKKILEVLRENKFPLIAIILSSFIIGVIIAITTYYEVTPQILSSAPISGENWSNYDKPIEVKFNVPVQISTLEPKFTPKAEGEWVWEKFLYSDYTIKGKFYPKETFYPDQRIVIYIVGAKRLFVNSENHELALNLFSPKPPEVTRTIPANEGTGINRDDTIKIYFNKANLHLVNWKYSIEPAVELEELNLYASYLELKPKSPLDADTTYTIKLDRFFIRYDLENSKLIEQYDESNYNHTFTFKTLKEPFIEELTPQGTGIHDDAEVNVRFTLPMKRESVEANFLIEPYIPGIFVWFNETTFKYNPTQRLEKGTKYNVKFKKGIESLDQGPTYRDLEYSFETVGVIKFTGSDPTNGNNRVGESTQIRIGLDQEVDHTSAENSFRIVPEVTGTFSWSGNDLVFSPSSRLAYNQNYTVTLYKNVTSIYGQNSVEDFTFSFTIRPAESIIGGVPQLYQPYGSFSCNVYAGLMGLSYKGFNISASGLISETGYNPNQSGGNWSGNPYREYVGNSDGSYGYGIYWTALQGVFNNRGIATEIKEGWNISSLAATIVNGNPVIIWRYNGESANYDKNWTAADGTYVRGINGQHGGTVIGVRGPTNAPEAFLVNDPWYGQMWFSADYLDYTWSRMNRTALVIY